MILKHVITSLKVREMQIYTKILFHILHWQKLKNVTIYFIGGAVKKLELS